MCVKDPSPLSTAQKRKWTEKGRKKKLHSNKHTKKGLLRIQIQQTKEVFYSWESLLFCCWLFEGMCSPLPLFSPVCLPDYPFKCDIIFFSVSNFTTLFLRFKQN